MLLHCDMVKLSCVYLNSGPNETAGVEVDSELQSSSSADAATAFAVLGWLAVPGVVVVLVLLWYWYRRRNQRKYKA